MNIQWQARTFHSFAGKGLEDIIVYNVPFDGELTISELKKKIVTGKFLDAYVVNPTTLRVAVKFD